jgi:hypothetical protein
MPSCLDYTGDGIKNVTRTHKIPLSTNEARGNPAGRGGNHAVFRRVLYVSSSNIAPLIFREYQEISFHVPFNLTLL